MVNQRAIRKKQTYILIPTKDMKIWLGFISLIVSLGISTCFIVKVSNGSIMSSSESILFQIFILFTGIFGSSFVGDILKDNIGIKSSIRNTLSLYKSMGKIIEKIDFYSEQESSCSSLEVIRSLIEQLLCTVDNSIADWNDIAPPGVVYELLEQVKKGGIINNGNRID